MPALITYRDGNRSRVFRWEEGSVGIGRHESNDLFLSDGTVSRWHAAVFETENGSWRLRDLGSSDGTWVHGKKRVACELEDATGFDIGPYRLVFRTALPDEDDPALLSLDGSDDPLPKDLEPSPLEPAPDAAAPLWEVIDEIAGRDGLAARVDAIVATIAARTQPTLIVAGRTAPGHSIRVAARRVDARRVPEDQVRPSRSLLRQALHRGVPLVWREAAAADVPSIAALGVLSAIAIPIEVGPGESVAFYADWRAGAQPEDAALEWITALALATAPALADAASGERLARDHRRLARAQRARTQFIGISQPIRELVRDVDRCAAVERDVLLLGETGTGKELLARRIHERSPRCAGPFVVVDANTIPAELFESELFGHTKGSFTGATRDREGKVALAAGGTLFIDEIGDLPAGLQGKLLRLLQEREYRRLGEDSYRKATIRVIAATHRNLGRSSDSDAGVRLDLRMRMMQGVVVKTPPLRERPDDIPLLSYFFLDQLASELDLDVAAFAPDVIEAFLEYSWPGNVRELRALVSNAIVFAEKRIRIRDFRHAEEIFGLREDTLPSLHDVEREHVIRVLHATRGNQKRAAEVLGINPNTLKDKMDRHGLQRGDFRTRK